MAASQCQGSEQIWGNTQPVDAACMIRQVIVGGVVQARISLGCSVEEAFAGPQELAAAQGSLRKNGFAVWYRPEQSRVLVILRQGVVQRQILQGAFSAHVFLHMLNETLQLDSDLEQPGSWASSQQPQSSLAHLMGKNARAVNAEAQMHRQQAAMREVSGAGDPTNMVQLAYAAAEDLYPKFLRQAEQQGWQLDATMLNTKDVRLCMA